MSEGELLAELLMVLESSARIGNLNKILRSPIDVVFFQAKPDSDIASFSPTAFTYPGESPQRLALIQCNTSATHFERLRPPKAKHLGHDVEAAALACLRGFSVPADQIRRPGALREEARMLCTARGERLGAVLVDRDTTAQDKEISFLACRGVASRLSQSAARPQQSPR